MVKALSWPLAAALMIVGSHALAGVESDKTGSPYFFVKSTGAVDVLPLKETRADVSIAGVIARVRVTQVYQNEGSRALEAEYVFPGSTRAAVFGMRMKIGARTIEAKIDAKGAARQLYESAKEEGKTASLLEQHRPNVLAMSVANIMPGDRIEVVLDYTELMVPTDGVYELVYPTVVGPRYVGGATETYTANPHLHKGEAPTYKWGLSAKISAGMPVSGVASPSHRISPRFEGSTVAKVEVDDESGGNRDFVLHYTLQGGRIDTGLLMLPGDKESFFLMMMQPPSSVAPSAIPPREYVFIVDVSGSMHGFPLDIAKGLMRELLGGLRPIDRFNVMAFSGGSAVLSEESVEATRSNIARAMEILDKEQGGGATEIVPAMTRALALPRQHDISRTMVVITDGYVSVEKETFELIRRGLGRANLFAFGVGTAVNRFLIEGMARAGQGEPFVVMSPGAAPSAAERFKRYVESPVLSGVGVDFKGFDAYDVEPAHVPDLFASRPLIITGKFRGPPSGKIVVSGHRGDGDFTGEIEVAKYAPSEDLVALKYLWARSRIDQLTDQSGLDADAGIKKQIESLGLQYGLVTSETSFVAIDSASRNTDGKPSRVRQALPMPEGVGDSAIASKSGLLGIIGGGGRSAFGASIGDASGLGGLGTRGAGGFGASGYGEGGGGHMGKKSAPAIVAGRATVMGSLDREIIQRVIKSAQPRVRVCYEKRLGKVPGLQGKVVVSFTIASTGEVTSASIQSTTLADEEVESCVLTAMRALRFPKPSGGGVVQVNYPFIFSPSR
jgi:Ca-activated chloride channel family protein